MKVNPPQAWKIRLKICVFCKKSFSDPFFFFCKAAFKREILRQFMKRV
jgi:hypothetical protein